eukprot:TRINITY_DN7874_c0_g1_i1.p1 TRINITY_DN7874_c0_g1~~TRINITY_DN7874_c0_g1_i1.p1  ORF type:complete len:579 (+),score=137.77 TRINITY_DN7874_c0_g1_i1:76-1737(+)
MGSRAAVLLAALAGHADGARIGFVALPELGHFKPLKFIGKELAARGHDVEYFMLQRFAELTRCRVIDAPPGMKSQDTGSLTYHEGAGVLPCVVYGDVGMVRMLEDSELLAEVTRMPALASFAVVEEHLHQFHEQSLPLLVSSLQRRAAVGKAPDILVVDTGIYAGFSAADKLGIPAVGVWPLTLSVPLMTQDWMPHLGTAFPREMSTVQRLGNFLLRRLAVLTHRRTADRINEVRRANGVREVDPYDTWYRRPLLTPGLFGLDVAQPLCPNVRPVGFLIDIPAGNSSSPFPAEFAAWVERCTERGLPLVYMNMGTAAVLTPEMVRHMLGFANSGEQCVVWKLGKAQQAHLDQQLLGTVWLSEWLPFHPVHLLADPRLRVFVTHCGDTSVAEALAVGVPLVGIPLFADQPDVCARVRDAEAGEVVWKEQLTGAALGTEVRRVIADPQYARSAARLAALSRRLRGPQTAADFIEDVAAVGAAHLFCPNVNLPVVQFLDLDIWAAVLLVVLTIFALLGLCVRRLCCGCCRPAVLFFSTANAQGLRRASVAPSDRSQ